MLLIVALVNHLCRFQALQKFINIFFVAFANKHFACRNIQQGNACSAVSKMNSSQEIIAVMLQHFIAAGGAGCHHFGYATLHNSFGLFGIFQLVANGYPVARLYQFVQVSIQCVMRKACQLTTKSCAVISLG